MKIVFATNNAHKLQEVQQVLGTEFELVTLRQCGVVEDIPENEPTLEGNALAKAIGSDYVSTKRTFLKELLEEN